MRILVCGSRYWTGGARLSRVLAALQPSVIIEGEAPGADSMSRNWGKANIGSKNVMRFPAKWNEYGQAAGPIRNKQMLDEGRPELVVAFHDDLHHSKGTRDMMHQARRAGIPVLQVGPGIAWLVFGDEATLPVQRAISAASFALAPRQ